MSQGGSAASSVIIVVDPLDLTVPVENQTLPGGQVGQAHSASIVVAGGVPPYSFTLAGSLLEGLTLNPATGAITGTPTKAQTSTFSITIKDSVLLPQSAMAKAVVHGITQSFSITVAAAPVIAAPTPVPTLGEWAWSFCHRCWRCLGRHETDPVRADLSRLSAASFMVRLDLKGRNRSLFLKLIKGAVYKSNIGCYIK